jgi:GST-like protein
LQVPQSRQFPHLQRWFERVRARPATERAYAVAKGINTAPTVDDAAKKVLFGQDASTISAPHRP